MGVCLSCLGLRPPGAQSESSESARLLANHSNPQYGGAETGEDAGAGVWPYEFFPRLSPEQEQREREALNAIWKQTSDKLIDVSITQAQAHHSTQNIIHTSTAEESTRVHVDYARLFSDTFPRASHSRSKSIESERSHTPIGDTAKNVTHEAPNHNNQYMKSTIERRQGDTFHQSDAEEEPTSEAEWLRRLIMRDPNDKSWDCNTVFTIGKPLVVSFDDYLIGKNG